MNRISRSILTLIICLFVSTNNALAQELFKKFDLKQSNYLHESFPRDGRVLYRGLNPLQMNYIGAIRAMLGDESSRIETPLLYSIQEMLKGKGNGLIGKIASVRQDYVNLNLADSINEKIKSYNGERPSEREAFDDALEILVDKFESYSAKKLEQLYLDYESTKRNDWPAALLYSSIYIETAKNYSPHIVLFQEKDDVRSIDLNYYNKLKNDKWVGTNKSWPDKGEFLTPYYIPARHIIGYQYKRLKYHSNLWANWEKLQNDLAIMFLKSRVGDKDYVLIVDGHTSTGSLAQHVIKYEGKYVYAKSNFDPSAELPLHPSPAGEGNINLIGIIELCEDVDPCDDDLSKKFPQYLITGRKLDSTLEKSISEVKFEKKKIRVFTYEDVVNQRKLDFRNNILSKNEDELKVYLVDSEDKYKLSKSGVDCTVNDLLLSCSLDKEVKLSPNEYIYISIPSDLQDTYLDQFQITHRQDIADQDKGDLDRWDENPGYMSLQLYPKNIEVDDWRYFRQIDRHKNPKGSLFSSVSKVDDVKPTNIDLRGRAHVGTQFLSSSKKPLNLAAIRVVSVGKDPIYIKNINFNFSIIEKRQ